MDPLIICGALLVLPIFAYINVSINKAKYKKIDIKEKKSGFEVAKEILDEYGIDDVYIVEAPHSFYDSYDSNRKTIKLRTEVFHGESIAAASIAAHECVHALQDKENFSWMKIRKTLLPAITFINKIAYITLLIGIAAHANDLLLLSSAILGICLVFHVVTLPVEYDASSRAKELLLEHKIVGKREIEDCESVLSATSQTYISTVLTSLFQIVFDLIDFIKTR